MFVFATHPGTTEVIVSDDGIRGFVLDWAIAHESLEAALIGAEGDPSVRRSTLDELLKFGPMTWRISPNVTHTRGVYRPIEPEDTDDDTTDS